MPTLNSFQTLGWPKKIQRQERAMLQYATQLISIRQGSLGFWEQQFILLPSTYVFVALQKNNVETCILCQRQMLFPSITGGNRNRQQGQHLSVLATICSGCHYCHNLKYELNNLLHTEIYSLYYLFIATVFLACPSCFLLRYCSFHHSRSSDLPRNTFLPFQEIPGLSQNPQDNSLPFFASSLFGELLSYT